MPQNRKVADPVWWASSGSAWKKLGAIWGWGGVRDDSEEFLRSGDLAPHDLNLWIQPTLNFSVIWTNKFYVLLKDIIVGLLYLH